MSNIKTGYLKALFVFFYIFHQGVSYASDQNDVESREFVISVEEGVNKKFFTHGVKLANGKLVLMKDMRSDDLERMHKEYCNSIGGEDIYDETTNIIGENVVDVIVCQIEGRSAQVEKSSEIISALYTPSISLVPPSKTIPVMVNYNLDGYMYYSTGAGGEYSLNMVADQCAISNGGLVGSNVYNGVLNVRALCVAQNPGTWPSYLNGCIPGLCATAVGEIRAID